MENRDLAENENISRVDIKEVTEDSFYGKYVCEPLEKGYGNMLGISLRRVLLSSIDGFAITSVRIDNIWHEFSVIPGVRDDVTAIILNLKEIRLKKHSAEPCTIRIDVDGEHEVTAGDIVADSDIEIMNPDQHIATVNENGSLHMEMTVEYGRGYVPSEKNKKPDDVIGIIPVDAIFSPVKKVNYLIDQVNVDGEECDRLTMEVWTDGTVHPKEAVGKAAWILSNFLVPFYSLTASSVGKGPADESDSEGTANTTGGTVMGDMKIEDMDLSVRSYNCLMRAGIHTVGELILKTEEEIAGIRNMGVKSVKEIKTKLQEYGLKLKGYSEQ